MSRPAETDPPLEPADDLRLVLTTLPDADSAERLARELLERRLIACANLAPGLTSLFWWKGEISRETEILMIMKAPESHLEMLSERVSDLHPYDVPEFLVLPLTGGSPAYCQWVRRETREVSA